MNSEQEIKNNDLRSLCLLLRYSKFVNQCSLYGLKTHLNIEQGIMNSDFRSIL